jgi:hypothetical protein
MLELHHIQLTKQIFKTSEKNQVLFTSAIYNQRLRQRGSESEANWEWVAGLVMQLTK